MLAKEIRALRKKLEQEQQKAASGTQSQPGSSHKPPGPAPPETLAPSPEILDQLAVEKQRCAELAARVDDLSSQLAASDRGDPPGDPRGGSSAIERESREHLLVSRLEESEKGRADAEAALKEAEEKLRQLQQAGGAGPPGDSAFGQATQAWEGQGLRGLPDSVTALPNGALELGVGAQLAEALLVSKDAARAKVGAHRTM